MKHLIRWEHFKPLALPREQGPRLNVISSVHMIVLLCASQVEVPTAVDVFSDNIVQDVEEQVSCQDDQDETIHSLLRVVHLRDEDVQCEQEVSQAEDGGESEPRRISDVQYASVAIDEYMRKNDSDKAQSHTESRNVQKRYFRWGSSSRK